MAQKVTEKESKEKWCRHTRRFHNRDGDIMISSVAINRGVHSSGDGNTNCYGPGCMAWEWDKEGNKELRLEGDDRKGYCDAENGDGKIAIV